MDKQLHRLVKGSLVWYPKEEFGYCPVSAFIYDEGYYLQYVKRAASKIGVALNKFRKDWVNKYVGNAKVLDIGPGALTFMDIRKNCLGYDVNPVAIVKLKERDLFFDPYTEDLDERSIKGVTFFDSLEHIEHISLLLARMKNQTLFISIPLFRGIDHILKSKHLKEEEHFYYFTMKSLVTYVTSFGFRLLDVSTTEIVCGREDIYSFVFR